MQWHHFFLSPDCIKGDLVHFPDKIGMQIQRVLRLRSGDVVVVLDNQGGQFKVELVNVEGEMTTGKIMERLAENREPAVQVTLCISLTQRDKFELILQKATEVGVVRVQPFVSRYSLVRDTNIKEKRRIRWEDILREAAEQSGRLRIPVLEEVETLPKMVERCMREQDGCLMAWVGEKSTTLKKALREYAHSGGKAARIAIFIGPEGGFAQQEVDLLAEKGVQAVSLGMRVMRMETAAIVAPALILHELEG